MWLKALGHTKSLDLLIKGFVKLVLNSFETMTFWTVLSLSLCPLLRSANDQLGPQSHEKVDCSGRRAMFCTEPSFAHASLSLVAFMHRDTHTKINLNCD